MTTGSFQVGEKLVKGITINTGNVDQETISGVNGPK